MFFLSQPGAERHHMVSGTLAPLYSFWVKVGLKRGSGPDRGRSPVEWGDFPFVRPSVRPSVHPSVHPFPPSRAQEPARQALEPAKRHVVSGTLAPLYTVFGLKLGCSGAAAPIGDEVL